jgi:hypothetical protein
MPFGAAWGKFMKENWSRQSHAPAKAAGDKTGSLLSYARPLEASTNAFIALKAAWNLLSWDQEDYECQGIWLVEGERVVDLGRRSGRGQDPTPNQVSPSRDKVCSGCRPQI